MLLIIDNYDSFTYNLAQYFSELSASVSVIRNDAIPVGDIEKISPSALVISPGPGYPKGAGISQEAIGRYAGIIPILGVCLGHQAIGEVFGGQVVRAPVLMHGKTSPIRHAGQGVFEGLPDGFEATRYHSLVVARESIPDCLEITAWTDDGLVMGLRHREYPALFGVQFHPESIMTAAGPRLLANFLKAAA